MRKIDWDLTYRKLQELKSRDENNKGMQPEAFLDTITRLHESEVQDEEIWNLHYNKFNYSYYLEALELKPNPFSR